MAIDSLNSTSAEQLLAMSMIGNGQTTSSDLSSSVNESDIAFETVMQNLANQSSNGDSSTNDMSTEQLLAMSLMSNGQLTSGENSSESRDMSNQMSLATALMMKSLQESKTSNSNSSDKNVVEQTCPTGQDLEKLAMIVNGRPVDYNYSSFISDNISPADKEQIYAAVKEAAKKYGVNENLILAIIKQESNFNSTAVSNAGAMGLMQVMPANFSSVNITNPYDVNQNVNGGTKILKECLDRFNGNIDMALMAYNGGSGNMQRRGVNSSSDLYKMPVETQKYVPSVLSYYRNGF